MSDPDRGPYSPRHEKPLSFDARRPERGGGGGVPVTLLVSGAILIVLVITIIVFYQGGVRGADDAPQAVGEPVGEIKSLAPADAQPADSASGLQIYSDAGGPANAEPTFAAPPEQPAARPAPKAAAPAQPSIDSALADITAARNAGPSQPPPAPAAKAAPAPAPAPAPAAVPAGGVSVQVGAFTSSALADRGWADAVRLAPGAAAGKGKAIEQATVNGQVRYRALLTGFESRAAAQAFCASLTAAGGNCLVR